MIILKSLPGAFGLRSASPFCMKAEALLALSGLEFEIEIGDPRKSPTNKLPVLVDEGQIIADTSLIKKHLEDQHSVKFDDHLNAHQKALALAVQRMVEDHLYFAIVYFRWVEHPDMVRETFFNFIPAPIRKFVFSKILKKVKRDLQGHGLARHDRENIIEFAAQDLQAISTLLGDNKFFFGEQISSTDAVLFGALEILYSSTEDHALKDVAKSFENLQAYDQRLKDALFGH